MATLRLRRHDHNKHATSPSVFLGDKQRPLTLPASGDLSRSVGRVAPDSMVSLRGALFASIDWSVRSSAPHVLLVFSGG